MTDRQHMLLQAFISWRGLAAQKCAKDPELEKRCIAIIGGRKFEDIPDAETPALLNKLITFAMTDG